MRRNFRRRCMSPGMPLSTEKMVWSFTIWKRTSGTTFHVTLLRLRALLRASGVVSSTSSSFTSPSLFARATANGACTSLRVGTVSLGAKRLMSGADALSSKSGVADPSAGFIKTCTCARSSSDSPFFFDGARIFGSGSVAAITLGDELFLEPYSAYLTVPVHAGEASREGREDDGVMKIDTCRGADGLSRLGMRWVGGVAAKDSGVYRPSCGYWSA
mmetsp:Transcript_3479/g.9372  ORF Transcript_3479/g.9372 Transcript_3479/m.9372 type:complete len:216 (-) Transcript_3479:115-762(-)